MNFNLLFFIRLFLRHIALLIAVPIILAVLVFYFTKGQPQKFTSKTKIYTGIASGSSIEVLENQRFDFFATNTAFDNLINIVKARNTIENVGLELFTQHMLLEIPDSKIISPQKYQSLMEIVPDSIKKLVVKGDYQKTLTNFRMAKESGHQNFVYKLINLKHADYSAEKILSKITVRRISNSDLVEISYESDDAGICQNTLLILSNVFVRLYAEMKVNQSDAVVKYFNEQLALSNKRLTEAEDELLDFNRSNNIINYYEQTKHIASQKEHFEMEYQGVQMRHEATKSVSQILESKMSSRQKLRVASEGVLEARNKISAVNIKIAMKSLNLGLDSVATVVAGKELAELQLEAERLNNDLRQAMDTLYWVDNDIDGLSTNSILEDWLKNIIEYEGTKAQLLVLEQKRIEFRELYTLFAPLGATMKRLERKIDVAEKEYLSLLHSLALAKLKQQNIELTSNLKMIDIPYFPIMPEASKRKILVAIAGIMGFVLVAFFILLLEFLDVNIKNARGVEDKIGLKVAGIFPRIETSNKKVDNDYIIDKATDAIVRHVVFSNEFTGNESNNPALNIFISTQKEEGKSFLCTLVSDRLIPLDYKVLLLSNSENLEVKSPEVDVVHYSITEKFYRVTSLEELVPELSTEKLAAYNFIFLEVPDLLNHAFPVKLFNKSEHIYLVTRANRPWSAADKNVIKTFTSIVKGPEPAIILNGVELQEMETIIGDLPRKRSMFRRILKNIIRLRFYSKNKVAS